MAASGPTFKDTLFELLPPEVKANILELLPFLTDDNYDGLRHLLTIENILMIEQEFKETNDSAIMTLWTALLRLHFPHLMALPGDPRDLFLKEYYFYLKKLKRSAKELDVSASQAIPFLLESLRGDFTNINQFRTHPEHSSMAHVLLQCAAANGHNAALRHIPVLALELNDDNRDDLDRIFRDAPRLIEQACIGNLSEIATLGLGPHMRAFFYVHAAVGGFEEAFLNSILQVNSLLCKQQQRWAAESQYV